MALRIVHTPDFSFVSSNLVDELSTWSAQGATPVVLTPSFEVSLSVQKSLARQGCGFNILCTTLASWIEKQWRLFGTQETIVNRHQRYLLAKKVIFKNQGRLLPDLPGMVRFVSEIAESSASCVSSAHKAIYRINGVNRNVNEYSVALDCLVDSSWNDGEVRVLRVLDDYLKEIASHGLIEQSCAAMQLIDMFKQKDGVPPVYFVATTSFSAWQYEFVVQLAKLCDVSLVLMCDDNPASELVRTFEREVRSHARASRTPVEFVEWAVATQFGSSELAQLSNCIFKRNEEAGVVSQGDVELLISSGPRAEARLVADAIERDPEGVIVAASNVESLLKSIKDKLAAQNIAIQANVTQSVVTHASMRVLAGFLQTVAHLMYLDEHQQLADPADLTLDYFDKDSKDKGSQSSSDASLLPNTSKLDRTTLLMGSLFNFKIGVKNSEGAELSWEEFESTDESASSENKVSESCGKKSVWPLMVVGDVEWWPPTPLIDFLLSPMSGMDKQSVWNLNAKWSANRLLRPCDVLKDLKSARTSSEIVAKAMDHLLQGRIIQAVHVVREAFNRNMSFDDLEDHFTQLALETAEATLCCIKDAGYLKFLSESKDLGASLEVVCDLMLEMVSQSQGFVSVVTHCDNPRATVRLVNYSSLKSIDTASYNRLMYVGCDSERMAVSASDKALDLMKSKLAHTALPDRLAQARFDFRRSLSLAKHLDLERLRYNAQADELFPAVVLTELLEAYGYHGYKGKKLPVPCVEYTETDIVHNYFEEHQARSSWSEQLTGLSEAPVRDASTLFPGIAQGSDVVLSASQIESYRECPYKWFVQRRLGLNTTEAQFSGLEMGTFVHHILETTHKKLLAEAHGISDISELQANSILPPNPLSRITTETLPRAQEILRTEFADFLKAQYGRGKNALPQALVAHEQSDEYAVYKVLKNLDALFEYQVGLFDGFEPRLFELRFGGKRGQDVTYAGIKFTGSIDRVDIDAQGNALIIDYKNKSFGAKSEYSLRSENGALDELPRHVQSLIYAQVLRRCYPDLRPIGAVYLACKPGYRDEFGVSGAVEGACMERIWGVEKPLYEACAVMPQDEISFFELLDKTEEAIEKFVVKPLLEGHVAPNPCDENACTFCPVTTCPRRA